jgi:hypothetical protein
VNLDALNKKLTDLLDAYDEQVGEREGSSLGIVQVYDIT